MKRNALIAAAFSALSIAAPAHAADPVAGRWLTEGGQAIVAIRPCGANLCGAIERVVKPTPGAPTTDAKNPNPALRSRPYVGLTILSNFKDAGSDWRGQIYDPKSGKTYRSMLKAAGNNLEVKGCVAVFCRSQTWTRVK
ncbi:DUF2147 domain-containing protein [Sphingomonas sp. Y38-1Y]|uniref:DUF2147 domain-containing protein n=1 Tax=Sphingomonas sp. Y38-1Y TaxID=3078265 RepID=UPI0028E8A43D|nr:DUF2147 domain-containing protein [Sphingomonas sp. Y38-1Y]